MSSTLMSNYARLPVTFTKGEGAWLWDSEDKRYLDALSGIAVCGLGHAHPNITAAICDQAHTLLHTSNLYGITHQQALADALVRITGMEKAFFCNSGAEANEAAIKIARLYGHQQGIDTPTVIVTEGAFHGRTLATLTATGNRKAQMGFEPLMPGFIRVPYDDIAAIERIAAQADNSVVAVLVEPIKGEGGIVIPAADYLIQLRALCDQHNWLLMLDEIQTGMGRTGYWMAYQQYDIVPDVLSLAKGLGNGVPIGASLTQGKAAALLQPGTHGSTFGGNPLVCRVALAVIETIEQQQLLARISELGQIFAAEFAPLRTLDGVKDVRNQGLLIGIELEHPCPELVKQALAQGVLLNVTAERVIRLLPPFIITDAQAEQIIRTVSELVTTHLHAPVTQ